MATRRCRGRVFGGSLNASGSVNATITSAALAAGTGSMTFNIWVRISAASYADSNSHELASYQGNLYATTGWLLTTYGGQCNFYHQNGGGPVLIGPLPRSVIDRWSMITVVVDAGTGKGSMYLNGEVIVPPTTMAWNVSANSALILGVAYFGALLKTSRISRTVCWIGTALTADQVREMYYEGTEPGTPAAIFNGTPTYTTSTPNDGSVGGNWTTNSSQWWTADVPYLARGVTSNALTYSNDLSNAAWVKFSNTVSVSASPVTHPTRPGASVWRVTEDTGTSVHLIRQTPSGVVASGTRVRVMCKVRGGGGRGWVLLAGNGGGVGVYINTSTGAIGTVASVTNIQTRDLGNSWTQISMEYTTDGTQVSIYLASANGSVSYTGNSSYIDVCDVTYQPVSDIAAYVDTTANIVMHGLPVGEDQTRVENLIPNSNTLTSWTASGATVAANGIAWDVTDDDAGAYEYVLGTVTNGVLDVGKRYCFEMFVKKTVGATSGVAVNITMAIYTAGIRLNPNTGTVSTSSSAEVDAGVGSRAVKIGSADYWHVWTSFTAQASGASVYFYPTACALSGNGIGSDSVTRTGTATVYGMSLSRGEGPTAGRLLTGSSVNGWKSNPVPRSKSLQQNLLADTNDLTTGQWAAQAGVVVTSGATAPDGTATAFNIDFSAASVATGIYQLISLANGAKAGVTHTRSIWIKGASGIVSFTDPALSNGVITATMDGTWQQLKLTEVCSANGAGVWLRKGSSGTVFQVWHPSLNRSSGEDDYKDTGSRTANMDRRAGRTRTTGRGRISFEPRALANLVLDLWADYGVEVVAGGVAKVLDRSIYATHASQATAANRPVFNKNGIGGRASIDFATGLNLNGSMNISAGDFTAFIVHDPNTASSFNETLMDWAAGRLLFMHTTSTPGQIGYFDGASFKNAGAASAAAQVATYRLNSTGGNSASVRVNGTTIGSGLSYTQRALASTQKIGSDYVGTSPYTGKIGRILIYSGNLSLADVQWVEESLGDYYGINIASGS